MKLQNSKIKCLHKERLEAESLLKAKDKRILELDEGLSRVREGLKKVSAENNAAIAKDKHE